jgi:hypothetical protein
MFKNGVAVLCQKQKTGHLYLQLLGPEYVSELNAKKSIWTMETGNIRELQNDYDTKREFFSFH